MNGFLINPMIGGAAMAMSSVSVVLNSLRLKRKKINSMTDDYSYHTDATDTPHTYNLITAHDKAATLDYVQFEQEEEFFTTASSEEAAVYNVEGMMCNHCRTHVEEALNSIPDVSASVTLDPPIAIIEFAGEKLPIETLQEYITKKAGSYRITEI